MEAAVLKPMLRMLTDLASSGFRQEVLLSVGCALDRVVATPCGCPGTRCGYRFVWEPSVR